MSIFSNSPSPVTFKMLPLAWSLLATASAFATREAGSENKQLQPGLVGINR